MSAEAKENLKSVSDSHYQIVVFCQKNI